MLLDISAESGSRLSANQDFLQWILDQTYETALPDRLDIYWRQINERNMDERLYAIYRWVEPDHFSRRGFLLWLQDLSMWYDRLTGGGAVMIMKEN